MKSRGLWIGFVVLAILLAGVVLRTDAASRDAQAIREMYQRFDAAVRTKDLNTIMSIYVPNESLIIFGAMIPRQRLGPTTMRKSYEAFFAAFPGPSTSTISDLKIVTAGTMAYSHGVDTWVVTGKDGAQLTLVFRFTDVLRKINGKWLVVHEHLSFPVDFASGKADFLSKP